MTDSKTPFEGDITTVHAALEVSGTSWIPAVGDPSDTSKAGLHKLAPHDVDGLLGRLGRARTRAAASGGDVRVMLVYEAGYEGFWLARRLEGEDPGVVVCDPASLEVVRGRKKVRTDRIDARRMVRAPPAWDGGVRDAMSPVRVPGVAEEDRKRLLRRRERLLRERRRLPDTVDGLTGLHGLLAGNPARPGFRERPGGMETGYGGPLPPELPAEIKGILDRLELARAEMKVVEARKAELPGRPGRRSGTFTRRPMGGPPTPAGVGIVRSRSPTARVPRTHRRTPTTRRRWSGCAGSARTTRCCWAAGSSTGSSATGGSWPASRGWRRCPSRAGASTTTRGSASPAARCCAGTLCRWPGAGCGTSPTARSPRGSGAT